MIKTSRQLKDLIRNRAGGDSWRAQLLIRNYAMERFLERLTLSSYKDNFILKGGMLVSAMVGLDNRATMDMDTTLRNLPLSIDSARQTVEQIISIAIDDNTTFQIKDASVIMDEAEYGGVRITMEAYLDTLRVPLKIDISAGDQITPAEISYRYKLMFEEREIILWAYNLETVLAEKIETILSRAALNTRLRDFYDIYILQKLDFDPSTLRAALIATCRSRESSRVLADYIHILEGIEVSPAMEKLWKNYQNKNDYANGIAWAEVMEAVRSLCDSGI